ncbi:MAG: phosphoenolpyruvate carboxylase [Bacteroidetes bacterium]|nr:phosphoenolpyruvate carboxylase [Bacteroidota bacterium]
MQEHSYDFQVGLKYQLYNSIFLTLHFATIKKTGIELPVFRQFIEQGLEEGKSPLQIINEYFEENKEYDDRESKPGLLFRLIQYVERQIVLIDALEEAAYSKLNDLHGEGSLSYFLDRVGKDNKSEVLKKVLEDFRVKVVLTAHPTQFYPGNVLGIINDLSESFEANDLHQIRILLEQLGQTPFFKKEKPTPFDEATSLGWYLENIFYHAIPKVLGRVMDHFDLDEISNYRLLEVGFWPGGDRDGNPFVTTDITWQVARRLQFILYKAYYNDVRKLKRRLTFRDVYPTVEDMEDALRYALFEKDNEHVFDLLGFQDRLSIVYHSLVEKHNGFMADEVKMLLIKTKVFGSHFASLDIRQDSRVVHKAFTHLFGEQVDSIDAIEDYFELKAPQAIPEHIDHVINDTLSVFNSITRIQENCGELACHRFIISNCRSEKSVLEIYAMAKACGMSTPLNLDIIPLFETIDDLRKSQDVMEDLYSSETYRNHLTRRGDRQYIMLGFSDGTKDGGYFSANWSIYKAKERMTRVARDFGIDVVFFDGRGGPPARGGGNVRKYYAAQGKNIENKEIQLTIQGQTVSSKFSSVTAAGHYLENLLTAGLENSVYDHDAQRQPHHDSCMQEIADISLKAYVDLKNRYDFLPYLENRSPLTYFGKTNIGSRPSKRGGNSKLTLDDLRAIPFVGSWSAMKQNVPGYYGLGIALKEVAEKHGKQRLEELFTTNPFFTSLINNSMQSLSKTRMELTSYLGKDPEYGALWNTINDENIQTQEMISGLLKNVGWDDVLASMHSIELRESVVLPLLIIQQYALMQLERDEDDVRIYEKLIIRTLYGIINAARNSA